MDKSRIKMEKNTSEYLLGSNKFFEFAFKNRAIEDRIKYHCPNYDFVK